MTTILRLPDKDISTRETLPPKGRPSGTPGPKSRWRRIVSPLGPLTLVADGRDLVGIEFAASASEGAGDHGDDVLDKAAGQLQEYFAGERRTFDLPLRLEGTAFQVAVWRALAGIPYGETVSYAAIACEVGRPTAPRAVGRTVGLNPLPIVVPCHRVVGANGQLTGYRGGLSRKERLLSLERA